MTKYRLAFALMAAAAFGMSACDDENTSYLNALAMPGEMYPVARCTLNGNIVKLDPTACAAAGGTTSYALYVVNMSTATLSYAPFYTNDLEFKPIDISTAVPGVTSIPVGENPQSMTGDSLGAFVVLTSAIKNDLSIVSMNDNREIAYQELDKTPGKITYHNAEDAYYVFFTDGTVRRLKITFDCGAGQGVLPISCSLSKDNIQVTWEHALKLDGTPSDYVAHPMGNYGYVSFADKRHISVIGFDATAGSCLNGTSYPCEIKRLGAGFGCADGIDNDGNGLSDEQDPSCFYPWSVEGSFEHTDDIAVGWAGIGECNDHLDNDGDGFTDALDPGCVANSDASEAEGFQAMVPGTCADGLDNDGDGDTDRDDIKCRWPTDHESADNLIQADVSGLCRDGIDNNGDGLIDDEDLACYGKNGFNEVASVPSGRDALSIDPNGRWLYVLDGADSQIIVIDLQTDKTIDRSGWYPRNRVVGIPVSRLALDLEADIRQETIYNKNGHLVVAEEAIVFVSASNGTVIEYLIHQTLTHSKDNAPAGTAAELALRVSDNDDDVSYIGVVRCVGRICTDKDLPEVTLRERPGIAFFANAGQVGHINPDTQKPIAVPNDAIMASETWRIEYEGKLENDTRSDGYFSEPGVFKTGMDFCALGARPGDHLVLANRKGLNTSSVNCQAFAEQADGTAPRLEWRVTDVGPNRLSLEVTGDAADASALPSPECFANGLEFDVRAVGQWLITSTSTFVNRRITAGSHCVDNPQNIFGQTRFTLSTDNQADTPDAQTAFFSVRMPASASELKRGDAFEFTTRTGLSPLSFAVGSAPTDLKRFKYSTYNFLLISDASSNTVTVYDVDAEGINHAF
ncbi:MAG: hypothetical protein J6S69_10790 [Proteobacteria bacterium]|nr:hypothetical protein [Pseudomonadota bacterium]